MDIRYFAFLERLKQERENDKEDVRVRGEMVSQRAFVDEGSQVGSIPTIGQTRTLGVRVPPDASEIIGILPPVDIPEMIRLFDRFTLKDEMKKCIKREEDWLQRVEETCEEADQRLTRYHQRLRNEAEECLQLAKVLTEKKV